MKLREIRVRNFHSFESEKNLWAPTELSNRAREYSYSALGD